MVFEYGGTPLILAIFGFTWLCLRLAVDLDNDHLLLRLFFSMAALIIGVAGLNTGLQLAINGSAHQDIINAMSITYKASLSILFCFFAYTFIYYVASVFDWFRRVVNK